MPEPEMVAILYLIGNSILISSVILLKSSITLISMRSRDREQREEAINEIAKYIACGDDAEPIVVFAMFTNALTGQGKRCAIRHLAMLVTMAENEDSLFILEDNLNEGDLRAALKLSDDELKRAFILDIHPIWKSRGAKLICFAIGTRPMRNLDSPLSDSELELIKNRFRVTPNAEMTKATSFWS